MGKVEERSSFEVASTCATRAENTFLYLDTAVADLTGEPVRYFRAVRSTHRHYIFRGIRLILNEEKVLSSLSAVKIDRFTT